MAKDKKVEHRTQKEGRGEKWVSHYSSSHRILLVGEGDFSFSLSLALSFGSASNIVATSLDSYETKDYLGNSLMIGFWFSSPKRNNSSMMKLFLIPLELFLIPPDFFLVLMHRNLVDGFFKNASGMLRVNGEIHVTHKTTAPYSQWNIEELAVSNSLVLIECSSFKIENYPGYNHKRGSGVRCDEPFPLGECSTFKFILSSAANKMIRAKKNLILPQCSHQQPQVIPVHIPQHPSTFVLRQQQDLGVFTHPPTQYANSMMFDWQPSIPYVFRPPLGFAGSPPPASMSIPDEDLKPRVYTFGENEYNAGYSKFLVDTFGRTDNNVGHLKSLVKLYGRTDDYMSNDRYEQPR
ncbi:hypothetical protein RJ640_004915 [Escallonia rubra]|uniref:25S rRNA (uridine-N(3))-methyltransferase BMT5-like domain-containing protein n=1 Tax=Escallonia rubra TaxID=112253 RepID=A0AA88UJ67_9ASTE|nr:hypothetical protein RJ640_004915 [Escallonia rubra]